MLRFSITKEDDLTHNDVSLKNNIQANLSSTIIINSILQDAWTHPYLHL